MVEICKKSKEKKAETRIKNSESQPTNENSSFVDVYQPTLPAFLLARRLYRSNVSPPP
jgi:hypothetical protein